MRRVGESTLSFGVDIGGANTKTALVEVAPEGGYRPRWTLSTPFNVRAHAADLDQELGRLLAEQRRRGEAAGAEATGVTLTAESVGIFPTLAAGVTRVLGIAAAVVGGAPAWVVDSAGELRSLAEAVLDPLAVASANWAATARLVGPCLGTGLVVDVGSTTTDVIPVRDGRPASRGRTDLERLASGELVYTGMLRSYLPAFARRLPLGDGRRVRVASELRCLAADLHVLLGHIPEQEMPHPYTGRPLAVTRAQARENLARALCSDTTQLTEADLSAAAEAAVDEQVELVAEGIREVMAAQGFSPGETRAVAIGMGRRHLALPALQRAGARVLAVDQEDGGDLDPAVAVAVLAGERLRAEERCREAAV